MTSVGARLDQPASNQPVFCCCLLGSGWRDISLPPSFPPSLPPFLPPSPPLDSPEGGSFPPAPLLSRLHIHILLVSLDTLASLVCVFYFFSVRDDFFGADFFLMLLSHARAGYVAVGVCGWRRCGRRESTSAVSTAGHGATRISWPTAAMTNRYRSRQRQDRFRIRWGGRGASFVYIPGTWYICVFLLGYKTKCCCWFSMFGCWRCWRRRC